MNNINVIFLLVGFVIYFVRPRYVPFYYLIWPTGLLFLTDMFFPLKREDYDVVIIFYSVIYIWGCCGLTILFNYKRHRKREQKIFILLLMFLAYLFAIVIYRRGTVSSFFVWMMQYVAFVPLWLYVKYNNLNFLFYKRYIVIALCIEILIVFIQKATGIMPSFSSGMFAENNTVNIVGTFNRYNTFSDNCSLLLLSLVFINEKESGFIPRWLFVTLVIVGSILVFSSGARTVLIAYAVAVFLLVLLKFKNNRFAIVLGCAILFYMYSTNVFLLKENVSGNSDGSNYDRFYKLVEISQGRVDMSSETTLYLSFLLYDEFVSNPIIGPGKLFSSSNGYGGIITRTETMADSCNMLYICETGIIGVIFLVSFLVLIIKESRERLYPIVFVIYLLIVAVTDYGLFQGISSIYFIFVSYFTSPASESIQFHRLGTGKSVNSIDKG